MALKSSPDRYGTVAIWIHWLSAVLVLVLLATGFRAAAAQDVDAKAAMLRLHLPFAALLLALTLARIAWWIGYDQKPEPIDSAPGEQRLARAVHVVLYIVVLGMSASGIGMMVLSGAVPLIFQPDPVWLPQFWRYPPRVPHAFGSRLLLALLAFHIAAATFHHLVRGDRLLRRIWFTK
jgi:cytochrome b561